MLQPWCEGQIRAPKPTTRQSLTRQRCLTTLSMRFVHQCKKPFFRCAQLARIVFPLPLGEGVLPGCVYKVNCDAAL